MYTDNNYYFVEDEYGRHQVNFTNAEGYPTDPYITRCDDTDLTVSSSDFLYDDPMMWA